MEGFYFDIEADSFYLYAKKVWYIKFKSLDKKREMSVHPFRDGGAEQKIRGWIDSFQDGCYVVGHNHSGFDLWILWKFFGIQPVVGKNGKDYLGGKEVQFIDTYVLSMYLQPDNKFHSLAYLSSGAEIEKMDFRKGLIDLGLMTDNDPKGHEFSFYSDLMQTYCDTDVDSGLGVFFKLWEKAKHYYKKEWPHSSFRQVQKDYFLYQAQAYSGVKFDIEKAKKLVAHIEEEMAKIKAEVDPVLPPRGLKTAEQAFYKIPAKPFKKDGSLSATMDKWLEKHNAKIVGDKILAYGIECDFVAGDVLPVSLPMEIEDGAELKQYFLDNGWKPHEDFWNFKKDPLTNKPMRDPVTRGFIKTTPKIQHAGQICPNLEELEGFIPKKLVKFLSLRNRKGVVEGWLNNPRLEFDGRLSAEISGYTPTFRVKHRTVVNCPKADPKVLLGAEMRDLFTVDGDNLYIGTDCAALENRTVAAYTMKYDGGKFADIVLNGDSHCYSEDTEVLTLSGWKRFGDLATDEKVAQWESGRIEFVQPSHVVWQDYEGDMVSFESNKVSLKVTPDHRMVYFDARRPESVKVKKAVEFVGKMNGSLRFPVSGQVSNTAGVGLREAEIGFLVAAQADSYYDGSSYRFEFSRERKIHAFKALCKHLGILANETQGKEGKTSRFYVHKSKVGFLKHYLNEDKAFTDKLFNMSAEEARLFVEEIRRWDGTTNQRGAVVFDTTCKVSRDVVSVVATLGGYRVFEGVYREDSCRSAMFRSYISNGEGGCTVPKSCTEYYKGKIGCVSVPSSYILVRRGGKIVVSGNTFNAFAFFPHIAEKFDINEEGLKDKTEFKPYRNKAKTGAYLLAYGGGVAKLASSLNLSKEEAQRSYDNYWTMNDGLGKLKKNIERYYDTQGNKQFIPAWDGRLLFARGKNILINLAGQSCGAIAMSYSCCLMDTWLGEMFIDDLGRPYYLYRGHKVKRISCVHDEYSWEVEPAIAEDIRAMSVKAIVRAGEILKLPLPLDGEGKIDTTWKGVH